MITRTRPAGDDGASAVEYGLIVFAIAAVIAAAVFALGPVVSDTYSGACEDMVTQTGSGQSCS